MPIIVNRRLLASVLKTFGVDGTLYAVACHRADRKGPRDGTLVVTDR